MKRGEFLRKTALATAALAVAPLLPVEEQIIGPHIDIVTGRHEYTLWVTKSIWEAMAKAMEEQAMFGDAEAWRNMKYRGINLEFTKPWSEYA